MKQHQNLEKLVDVLRQLQHAQKVLADPGDGQPGLLQVLLERLALRLFGRGQGSQLAIDFCRLDLWPVLLEELAGEQIVGQYLQGVDPLLTLLDGR